MRILLVQGSTYVPSLGGANKANRLLLEQLAGRGHECLVIGTAGERTVTAERCREDLAAAGVDPAGMEDAEGVVSYRHAGVAVEAVLDAARLRARVTERIGETRPDRVLVSSEDPAQTLLRAALDAAPDRVVYIAHTTLHLPFGPDGFLESPGGTELLRRAAGILAVSRFVQEYLRRWAGLESTLVRFPVYGGVGVGPFPDLGAFDRGFVTLINPCAVKGIAVFLELARRCPDVAFAAVPTWGTTAGDRAALAALPNVEILPPTPAVDELYARTRVLLAPSLWGEAFGQVAVEAMLRGIPVLASNAGGLPEAMLGMDYVLPVRPIQRYEERFDDRKIPVAVVPPQDAAPWETALREVLGDRARYESLSRESRRAAHEFVAGLGIAPFEEILAAPLASAVPVSSAPAPAGEAGIRSKLEGLSPEKLALLARRLKKKDAAPAAPAGIPRQPRSGGRDVFPVSFAQQRLWFLDRFEAGSPFYNEYFAVRVAGAVDAQALEAALDAVVRRHEVLRTTFSETDGEPFQVVHPASEVRLPVIDLRGLPAAARKTEAGRVSIAESLRPFDLERGPVLRVLLLRLEPAEQLLLITAHHIVADNWSAGVLFGELAALYAGRTDLPELPLQYADYSVWQRERLGGEALAPQLEFWRRQLAGVPPVLELPADRPRPAKQGFRGARAQSTLPAELAESLRNVARRHDATLYMTLLASVQALLHRLTGQDDVVVGTPVAGRLRRELEPLIGFFLNTLPMRGRLAPGVSFAGLIEQARQTVLESFAHQEVPFERLVDQLVPERSLSHSPLFQVLVNLLNLPPRAQDLSGARLTPIPVEVGTTKFDLELYLQEIGDIITVKLLYSTDLFDATTAARMLRQYAVLLAGAVAAPLEAVAALPLLTAEEAHQLLVEANDTSVPLDAACVHERVAEQARRTPEAVAVAQGDARLTYRELTERAWRLAQHLRRLGVGPEERVGVALERSPEMVVSLLGVLAAGGAYVPLDPSYPKQRLALVLEDARPRVLLTSRSLETDLLAGLSPDVPRLRLDADAEAIGRRPAAAPDVLSDPENLAYVLFTSGSTGRPKGVEVPHRALSNFLRSMAAEPGFPAGGRLLAVTSLSFDIAALEIFLPLLAGGCVELAGRDQATDGEWLAARLASREEIGEKIQALQATPATWRMLLDAGWQGAPDLAALCGGEALPRSLAAALSERAGALWNLYGPTETTVWSAACRIGRGEEGPVSIGRPIDNTRLLLLDRGLRPVPAGVAGEVCIGGAGLARGYRGRPDLTAERFVPDPRCGCDTGAGARLYRTGDLARHLEGGRGIEVLGRLDHQVKVRGFRIELGEIESALLRHPAVREAVVAVRRDSAGEPRLVAWVVPANGSVSAADLRAGLAGTLPEHMLPAAFVSLAELPLTPNRKVDRNALPEPDRTAASAGLENGPAGAVEEMLAGIWSDLLGVGRVGPGDDFFALGGHSLLATRLVSRVRRAFGIELPVRAVFEAPALAGLARRVERTIAEGVAPRRPPIEPVSHAGAIPLSFAQQRLWYLAQLHPESPDFNIAAAVRMEGRLDAAALEAALGEVERRHEILRTTFPTVADVPVQIIAPAAPLCLPQVDLSGLAASARETECRRLALRETRIPFDLVHGPVWRATLVRLDAEEHAILLTLHHITSDIWSLGILVREMGALYEAFSRGLSSPLPELRIQFADFAAWQRRWLDGEGLAPELAYWRERLAGSSAIVLPTDLPRRPEAPIRSACRAVEVGPEVGAGLAALARSASATAFMIVLAAFKAVLALETGRFDLVVGSNVANRNRFETESLIGFFVNLLVLRTDLSGDPTFEELLARVREVTMGAYAHQDLPFDRLVQELEPGRSAGRMPLFQVKVDVLPAAPPAELPGLRLRQLDSGGLVARYDLHLSLTFGESGLAGHLFYDAGLFTPATVERLGSRFARLLAEAVRMPAARLSELAQRLDAADATEQRERRQALGRANLANLRQIRRRSMVGVGERF